MTNKEPGYVYILTNPSFREDWVKIGKSSRPVDVRSKELDNTAVPLPFEIFATMKTVKYNEVEKLVHKNIDRLSDLRIRPNREFFNVSPQVALDILNDISKIIDDANVTLYKDNNPIILDFENNHEKEIIKTNAIIKNQEQISIYKTNRDTTQYSFDGITYRGKGRFVLELIRDYVYKNPGISFEKLETIFPRKLQAKSKGVVRKLEDAQNMREKGTDSRKRFFMNDDDIILLNDGTKVVVNLGWGASGYFEKFLEVARQLYPITFKEKSD